MFGTHSFQFHSAPLGGQPVQASGLFFPLSGFRSIPVGLALLESVGESHQTFDDLHDSGCAVEASPVFTSNTRFPDRRASFGSIITRIISATVKPLRLRLSQVEVRAGGKLLPVRRCVVEPLRLRLPRMESEPPHDSSRRRPGGEFLASNLQEMWWGMGRNGGKWRAQNIAACLCDIKSYEDSCGIARNGILELTCRRSQVRFLYHPPSKLQ
jgi:hypothetical protein